MANTRIETLIEKLSRGIAKSLEGFRSVEPELWEHAVFDDPGSWNLKDLLAHFIYSEEHLLSIAQDIASGGEGAPEGIDIDAYNEHELVKLRHRTVEELLEMLSEVRETVMNWVLELDEHVLDEVGRHPVLGTTNVEAVINSIYAHQLLHMREIAPKLRA